MKHLFLILPIFIALASCSDSSEKTSNSRLELVPEPDKDLRKEYEKQQNNTADCVFSPDLSLAGIELRDAESTLHVLRNQTRLTGDSTHLFYSPSRKQALALTVYAGEYANQVSVFRVWNEPHAKPHYRQLETAAFVTGKGIHLGMSKQALTSKLGFCYTVNDSTARKMTLNYRIADELYYARYDFTNNKLEQMEFGYEYP